MAHENRNDTIEFLQNKLKTASKQKFDKEKELRSLQCLVTMQTAELGEIEEETKLLKQELNDLYKKIGRMQNQLSIMEICHKCDKTKVEAYMKILNEHKRLFRELFEKERKITEKHRQDLKEREEEQEEMKKLQQLQLKKQNQQQMKQVEVVEMECAALEQECAVLKKRNTAKMLQLRRKLVEADDLRESLIKK